MLSLKPPGYKNELKSALQRCKVLCSKTGMGQEPGLQMLSGRRRKNCRKSWIDYHGGKWFGEWMTSAPSSHLPYRGCGFMNLKSRWLSFLADECYFRLTIFSCSW